MGIGPLSISSLPAIKVNGVYRVLGLIPSSQESLDKFPKFAANFAAPAVLQEVDWSWYKPPVLDQGMTSACVGFSSTSGMHNCLMQSGRTMTQLSPFFLYGLINGGRDAGAQISDAMTALTSIGQCPLGDIPAGEMFKNQFPKQAFADAASFKLEKAFHCPTFADICNAVNLGFFTIFGLGVGSNFAQVDSNGVCPLPRPVAGGHALCAVGLKKSSQYGWMLKFLNSWGDRFGNQGYAYVHAGHFNYMAPDGFAIQSVIEDPNKSTDVPVVV